jgi:hypothetical protein
MRVYEKGAELREKWPILRFELQAMHDDAQSLFNALCTAPDPRPIAAGVLLRLDFIKDLGKLRKNRNQERGERYGWWQQILDRCGRLEPYDRTMSRVRDVERMVDWIKLSWPRPLAMLREMVGDERMCKFLSELASCDRAKLSDVDRELVKSWKESRSVAFL